MSDAPTLTTTRPDGRTLAIDVTGPDGGRPVLFLHAAPGSRRFDPDPAATTAAGVRLITVDRPGYGASSPWPSTAVPTIPALADDLEAVLDAVDVAEAEVVGWSAGGRIALAFAARHPERVRAVGVVATPAPDEAVPWIPQENRDALAALAADPAGATAALAPMLAEVAAEREGRIGMMSGGPADAATLEDPAVRARVQAMVDEGFRPGALGAAADIVSYTLSPWGFDRAAVGAPVDLFSGAEDPIVTPAHADWYAADLAAERRHVVPGAGHLVVVEAWAEVLAALSRAAGS